MQDSDIELLTAFVDGELNGRQRKAVLRLLQKSSEARSLLWQLRENAVAVQQLPAKRLPADFAARIMHAIEHAAAPSPSSTSPGPTPAASPVRLGRKILARFAMAAALLLAVGGAVLYVVYQPPQKDRNSSPIAENKPGPDEIKDNGNRVKEPLPNESPPKAPAPGYFALRELKDKTHLKALTKELTRPTGDRLELTVSNSTKAVHKIRAVLQSQGVHVIDASAHGKGKPTEFLVFTENTSPEELANLLSRIGGDDTFEGVQVAAMSGEDRKVLANVMGIDTEQVGNPHEGLKLLNPIIDNPVSDKKTIQPLPQPRPADGLALIVAAGSRPSPQIQSFLSQRRRLRPGTVQAILIVRQT